MRAFYESHKKKELDDFSFHTADRVTISQSSECVKIQAQEMFNYKICICALYTLSTYHENELLYEN